MAYCVNGPGCQIPIMAQGAGLVRDDDYSAPGTSCPWKALVFARYANRRLKLRGSKVDFLWYNRSTKADVWSSVLSAYERSSGAS